MKYFRFTLIILLAFIAVLFDTYFFGLVNFDNASILSSLALVIVFALFNFQSEFMLLSLAIIILLSIMSSLPVWFIPIGYLVVPGILIYIKTSYLPDTSLFAIFLSICLTCLIFELALMVIMRSFDAVAFSTLGYFILINSSVTMIIYLIARQVKKNFIRGEIKL